MKCQILFSRKNKKKIENVCWNFYPACKVLTFSFLQTKTGTFANSVDAALNEPSHHDLHCSPFSFMSLIDTPVCHNGQVQNQMEEPFSESGV